MVKTVFRSKLSPLVPFYVFFFENTHKYGWKSVHNSAKTSPGPPFCSFLGRRKRIWYRFRKYKKTGPKRAWKWLPKWMLLSDKGPTWGGTKRVLERDPEKRAPKDAKSWLKETKTDPSGAKWGQQRLEKCPKRLEAEYGFSFLCVYRYIRLKSIFSNMFHT